MESQHSIRAVAFRDGDTWVAQCLEYDIGAQAPDLDTLWARLEVTIRLECETSVEIHGAPFAGIDPAPVHFHKMWERRSGSFSPTVVPAGVLQNFQLAMCA